MASTAELRAQADAKRLSDLHKKHVAGKISKGEYQEYQKLLAEKEERERPEPSQSIEAWTVGNAELAKLLGVVPKTICEWVKGGMPKIRMGTYDFRQVFPWWMENINTTDDDRDGTLTRLKREHLREKIRKARVEANQAEAKVCAWTDIEDQWCQRVGEMRQALLTMSVRLPPLLEGKPLHDLRDILHNEACAFLSAYARGGTYAPTLTESQIQEVVTKCMPKLPRSQKRQPARSKRSRSKR